MRLFISHSTADNAIADRVSAALEQAGLTFWVDHLNGISYGARWQHEIQKAIAICDAGILLLSPTSAESEWCGIEFNEILDSGKKLYTALIAPTTREQIPLRLRSYQYADLTTDFDGVLAKLIAVITGKTAPDATTPAAAQSTRLTGFDSYELEYYPLLRHLPLAGRVDELRQIKEAPAKTIVQIVAVGGRGKSRLAYEAATTAAPPGGAVWHRMTAASDAEGALKTIKRHLRLPAEADADTTFETLTAKPALLVLDNAEEVPEGDPRRWGYLSLMSRAQGAGAPVLVTSRVEWKALKRRRVIDLDPLLPDPALAAAQSMNGALDARVSEADLQRVVRGAKGHPRLMEWVLNQIGGEHLGARTALHDLETLQSADAQAALDEMVLKTLAQMEREARDGAAAGEALREWCVFRGSFTVGAAGVVGTPIPRPLSPAPQTEASPPSPLSVRAEDGAGEGESEASAPGTGTPIPPPAGASPHAEKGESDGSGPGTGTPIPPAPFPARGERGVRRLSPYRWRVSCAEDASPPAPLSRAVCRRRRGWRGGTGGLIL